MQEKASCKVTWSTRPSMNELLFGEFLKSMCLSRHLTGNRALLLLNEEGKAWSFLLSHLLFSTGEHELKLVTPGSIAWVGSEEDNWDHNRDIKKTRNVQNTSVPREVHVPDK